MKIWRNLRELLFKLFKRIKPPIDGQEQKRKRASDYVDQLIKCYDKELNEPNNIGTSIGSSINSIHLHALQAKLLTGQQYVTDELLVELEKLLWTKI